MRLSVKCFGRVVAVCIALGTIGLSSGCTSGFSAPKWLSWNRTPDPDTLAAKGPTTSFPSPGSTQTPSAVVSSAGTGSKDATAKSAGVVDPKTGYGTPATYAATTKPAAPTTPSMAAAQANGYAGAAQPAGYVPGGATPATNPYAPPTQPVAGYAGQLTSTAQGYASQVAGTAQGYANQATGAAQNYANQATNAASAYGAGAYSVPPTAGAVAQTPNTGGYNIPGSGATPNGMTNGSTYSIPASYATPNAYAAPSNYGATAQAGNPGPQVTLPGQPTDSGYRTADASTGNTYSAPAASTSANPYATGTQNNPYAQPATGGAASGYRPGSTGRPTGYSAEPTNGAIYR